MGAEYYTSLGFANELLPAREQEHLLLGVVDYVPTTPEPPPGAPEQEWEVNVGVGGALTDVPGPHLLVKAIIGRSF